MRAEVAHWKTWMSPGHFYSPIPSIAEMRAREEELFGAPPEALPAIELNTEGQLALIDQLARFYPDMPFPVERAGGLRFWLHNGTYGYADAILLYAMLRQLRPARVIEVGCGMSSAVMLDTAERFLGSSVDFTFIDPDLSALRAVARDGDLERAKLFEGGMQRVSVEAFDALHANDILFVDSTHVAKTGSDVNRLVFDVLPRLRSGVYVHIHDIHYPFEYIKEWVYEGRSWNEAYIVRAFLEFNTAFEIVLFGNYLYRMHRERLGAAMPLAVANTPGSLWLKRR